MTSFNPAVIPMLLLAWSSSASAQQDLPPPPTPAPAQNTDGEIPDHGHGEDATPEPDEEATPRRFTPEKLIFGQIPVAIIPARREEVVTRAPSTVTVLDGVDVRRSGSRFLSDALRIVPGIEVLRTTSTESNVNARGYNDTASTAQGMLGLINGRQVYNDFFGNVLWDTLPVSLADVDRIEVIRGPGSFVHGPNAMHGVVNIVTRSPLEYDTDFLDVSAAAGTYESTQATATYVRRADNIGFKATFGWDNIAHFEPRNEGASNKGFMDLHYEQQLDADQRVAVTGGVVTQNTEVIIPGLLGVPAANLDNDFQEAFVTARYSVGDLQAQVVWTGVDSTSRPNQFYAPFTLDLDTLDLDLQYTFAPWERHTVTAGAGYSHATFKTLDVDVSNGRQSTDLVWGFIQDEIEVADDLVLTAGVRLDWYSESGLNVSPRLAAVWKFDELLDEDGAPVREQYLRASAGVGFRNPSLRENFFNMPVNAPSLPPLTIAGNENLDSERLVSFEVGYQARPLRPLKVGVNLFYNLVDDLIVFQPVPGSPTVLAPFNRNDEEVYGVELEVDYLFNDSLSGFANWSYDLRESRDTGLRIASAPRNKANVGLRLSTEGGVSGMLWANFFDETVFGGRPVNSYTLLNAQIAYPFTIGNSRCKVYLQGFNLVDSHREHPDGQVYDALVMGGISVEF